MSSNLAYATPVRRPREFEEATPPQPRVRIVTTRAQRRARPKLTYALVAITAIFAIFLAQLLITISLSSGAYTIDGLKSTQQNLGQTASALNERIDTLDSSQNLEANAAALGMVASSRAAFLRLSNGTVLGTASPAKAANVSALMVNGANGSVPNALLANIPVITPPASSTSTTDSSSTGTGHGASNATDSGSGNSESTAGTTPASVGGTTTPTTPATNNGELPSPETH